MVEALLTFVLYVIVLGLICYALFWLVGKVGLPDPFAKVANAAIAIVFVLLLIVLLLQFLPPLPHLGELRR